MFVFTKTIYKFIIFLYNSKFIKFKQSRYFKTSMRGIDGLTTIVIKFTVITI